MRVSIVLFLIIIVCTAVHAQNLKEDQAKLTPETKEMLQVEANANCDCLELFADYLKPLHKELHPLLKKVKKGKAKQTEQEKAYTLGLKMYKEIYDKAEGNFSICVSSSVPRDDRAKIWEAIDGDLVKDDAARVQMMRRLDQLSIYYMKKEDKRYVKYYESMMEALYLKYQ